LGQKGLRGPYKGEGRGRGSLYKKRWKKKFGKTLRIHASWDHCKSRKVRNKGLIKEKCSEEGESRLK